MDPCILVHTWTNFKCKFSYVWEMHRKLTSFHWFVSRSLVEHEELYSTSRHRQIFIIVTDYWGSSWIRTPGAVWWRYLQLLQWQIIFPIYSKLWSMYSVPWWLSTIIITISTAQVCSLLFKGWWQAWLQMWSTLSYWEQTSWMVQGEVRLHQ